MSTGPRIPLDDADRAVAWIFTRWALSPTQCHVVGSVRRRKEYVGDVELIAPPRDKHHDPEHDAIARTMEGYVPATLLDAGEPEKAIGRAVKGLKAGFKAASIELRRRDGSYLPVQIYRYTPDNKGWIMLMRTGPGDFGEWFLGRWKDRWAIPRGDARHVASKDGHLVDAQGQVVSVPHEEAAFEKCGIKYVPAERRAAFVEHVQKARGTA